VNFYAERPGTGVRKREKFCVRVTLLQTRNRPATAIALGVYRPPLHDPLTVAAIRELKPCKHSPNAPALIPTAAPQGTTAKP
jgi:hypothetical protein